MQELKELLQSNDVMGIVWIASVCLVVLLAGFAGESKGE
jgi:hypothetical protein